MFDLQFPSPLVFSFWPCHLYFNPFPFINILLIRSIVAFYENKSLLLSLVANFHLDIVKWILILILWLTIGLDIVAFKIMEYIDWYTLGYMHINLVARPRPYCSLIAFLPPVFLIHNQFTTFRSKFN